MSNNLQEYHLLIIHDNQGDRVVHLDLDQYHIGRQGNDRIKLFDPAVSRNHATLKKVSMGSQKHTYQIIDGDSAGTPSKNGLFINGMRKKSQVLQSSDNIQIGSGARLVYVVEKFTPDEFDLYCLSGVLAFENTQTKVNYQKQTIVSGV